MSLRGTRLSEESHAHMSHALQCHLCERDGEETGGCQDSGVRQGVDHRETRWGNRGGVILYPNCDSENLSKLDQMHTIKKGVTAHLLKMHLSKQKWRLSNM